MNITKQELEQSLVEEIEAGGAISDITGLQEALDAKAAALDVGDKTALSTLVKTNLVAAINEINAKPTGGDTTGLEKRINTLYAMATGLQRYQAYDELLKEASERLKYGRGTVLAHDMNGNIIGMTLDEVNSKDIVIRDGKMLMINEGEVAKTVADATVINASFETSGNGGRRLVRSDNDLLVSVVTQKIYDDFHKIYKSEDDGNYWTELTSFQQVANSSNVSVVPFPTSKIAVIHASKKSGAWNIELMVVDTVSGVKTPSVVDQGQTAVGNMTLTINPEGTELHAAWQSKNATHPNNWGIRYAKGVISQVDGTVTWGTVEQITTYAGYDFMNPSIVCDGSSVYIFAQRMSASVNSIMVFKNDRTLSLDNGTFFNVLWSYGTLYNGGTYTQSFPSAIFVPQSVNGLANGRIWVAWVGPDASNGNNQLRYSYSDDGGVTWSAMQKVVSGGNVLFPSITFNKNNEGFIVYQESANTGYIKLNADGTNLVFGLFASATSNVSTLEDTSVDFSKPLTIAKATSKVGFYGTWKETVETPSLTSTAVYDIPTTDYVGIFIDKMWVGEHLTHITPYVNDVLMETDDDPTEKVERMFTSELPSEVPVKLRIEMSRDSVAAGTVNCITKILGGIA